jgi:extracellular elastinolytic metalloproteinase
MSLSPSPSGETQHNCDILENQLKTYKGELASLKGDEGAWGLVKAAANVVLGGHFHKEVDEHEVKKIKKQIRHTKNHIKSVCDKNGIVSVGGITPVDALSSLLPRLSSKHNKAKRPVINSEGLTSTLQHSLKPKHAHAEPPTELISGPGLAAAGVVNDVPARLMYTQSSNGTPRLVWKFEVEMKDAWYESYVDVYTAEVIRIVDWTSDSPDFDDIVRAKKGKGGGQKPLPAPPKHVDPYTYNVFPFGESGICRR